MLFNSHIFIFFFLPLVLAGYYRLRGLAHDGRLPLLWLLLASVFFYAWWEVRYVVLLAVSIGINFAAGLMITRSADKRCWLIFGVAFNLALLAWFKYAHFLADNLGVMLGRNWSVPEISLPLAISFFTFQQIAWLVDVRSSQTRIPSFYNYALFVTFFPQLIAGPIVHHAEIMPQFELSLARQKIFSNLNMGLTLFSIGLFKKVVLADRFSLYVDPVFESAAGGLAVTQAEAWIATLAYTLQIYFDFSGYSDMAVGLARMFGIVLPLNFFSPYKSGNIRDFWQRWHITLSRFLRDYLYLPLGGNRAAAARVSANIMITMLIGGLWHGAAWTFVAWGGLHGLYLLIHRGFRRRQRGKTPRSRTRRTAGIAGTFIAVALAWVLFRAESLDAAIILYKALLGLAVPGASPELPRDMAILTQVAGSADIAAAPWPSLQYLPELSWLLAGCLICFFAPNVYQIMAPREPALIPANIELCQSRLQWRENTWWAILSAVAFTWSVLTMSRISEFLYFQF